MSSSLLVLDAPAFGLPSFGTTAHDPTLDAGMPGVRTGCDELRRWLRLPSLREAVPSKAKGPCSVRRALELLTAPMGPYPGFPELLELLSCKLTSALAGGEKPE